MVKFLAMMVCLSALQWFCIFIFVSVTKNNINPGVGGIKRENQNVIAAANPLPEDTNENPEQANRVFVFVVIFHVYPLQFFHAQTQSRRRTKNI